MRNLFVFLCLCLALICICDAWGRSRGRSSSRSRSTSRGGWGSRRRTSSNSRSSWGSRRRTVSTSRRRTVSTSRRRTAWSSRRRTPVTTSRRRFSWSKPVKTPKRTVVKKGPFGNIRGKDETGHRTGLGTIAKSFAKNPVKTVKSFGAFAKSWNEMRKKNLIGGNLKAHEKGNKKATEIGGAKLSSAISALREQYKRFRVKNHPKDGSLHVGDTRSAAEIKATMDANKKGRDQATKG